MVGLIPITTSAQTLRVTSWCTHPTVRAVYGCPLVRAVGNFKEVDNFRCLDRVELKIKRGATRIEMSEQLLGETTVERGRVNLSGIPVP
jgi:hypothetical protein